jgi:integrase
MPTRPKSFTNIIDAIKRRARAVRYGLPQETAIVTLKELVDERKKDFNVRKRNDRTSIAILDKFCECLGKDKPVHLITTADLRYFVQALRFGNPDLSPVSMNNYLNKVNALLRKAGTFFPALDTWKPPRMPFEDEGAKASERVITEEEIARLFFALRAPRGFTGGPKAKRREKIEEVRTRHMVADVMELSLMTGMRKTEARTLTKVRIDWEVKSFGEEVIYGFIQLPPTRTKTKEPRRIPLNWDARQLLERRCNESKCAWVFPNTGETGPISDTVLGRLLRRIAKKAGVPYGRAFEDGFTYHTSRHTAATRMLERGAHIKTVGRILGHTDETMTMRYAHTDYTALASAVRSLATGSKQASDETSAAEIPTNENGEAGK